MPAAGPHQGARLSASTAALPPVRLGDASHAPSTAAATAASSASHTGPMSACGGAGWSRLVRSTTTVPRSRSTASSVPVNPPCPTPPAAGPSTTASRSVRKPRPWPRWNASRLVVTIPLFLPLTVGVVAGDTIAGEAGHGTLRYLLLAPVQRGRLLLGKDLGAATFCFVATLSVVVVGSAIGALLFPVGPVTLLSGGTVGGWEALGRALLIAAYVSVSLLGLAAVGLFLSTLTVVPVGAMAATAVVAIVVQVLGSLEQLAWLHPWLLSEHWLGFADLLRQPIAWGSLADNALLQAGHMALFGALAYGRFTTKDVLS